jgi:hypothetical protein
MHMHTCQIKQNVILLGTNFETKTSFFLGRREYLKYTRKYSKKSKKNLKAKEEIVDVHI